MSESGALGCAEQQHLDPAFFLLVHGAPAPENSLFIMKPDSQNGSEDFQEKTQLVCDKVGTYAAASFRELCRLGHIGAFYFGSCPQNRSLKIIIMLKKNESSPKSARHQGARKRLEGYIRESIKGRITDVSSHQ